jgi:hypothetical protein
MERTTDAPAPTSRRSLLAAALGGAGGLVLGALGRPAGIRAANGDPVLLGSANTATALTSVENTDDNETSLAGIHSAAGTGVSGSSDTGVGVAASSASGTALTAFTDTVPEGSENATAVVAAVGDRSAISTSTAGIAIYGFSDGSLGAPSTWGDSLDGIGAAGTAGGGIGVFAAGAEGVFAFGEVGVYGIGFTAAVVGDASSSATGVYGFSGDSGAPEPAGGIGVLAVAGSTSQTALQVKGKAKFSRSGRISVASGKTRISKSVAGVTTSSMVFALLQHAESGTWVRAAVPASGKITIYFNKALPTSSVVAWFVLN